jgi:hypothetical protein
MPEVSDVGFSERSPIGSRSEEMTMNLIYPNIIPANNLRLPDALTVKHGPAPLLSRFVLEGDKTARQIGLRLRLRHDFGELLYLNQREVAHGNWFKLVNMYNPAYCELSPENSYWISGENEQGDIVLTQAGRIYYWPETSLAEEARSMFYAGQDEGQLCKVTAPAARRIGGVVFCAGSHWIRPDFRGHRLSHLLARLGRAYAMARWPVEWAIALVAPVLVAKGVSAGYGYKHASHSIFYPASPWGDLEVVLAYLSQDEAYEDIAEYLGSEVSASTTEALWPALSRRPLEDNVTSTSSEDVFHGSRSLS